MRPHYQLLGNLWRDHRDTPLCTWDGQVTTPKVGKGAGNRSHSHVRGAVVQPLRKSK